MRSRKLDALYEEMRDWACARYDPEVVQRSVQALDPGSELFVLSEAYARTQVRLTGVNWFDERGSIGPSGKYLDQILRCVGYTVYPPSELRLRLGKVRAREPSLRTVYTADIFPAFPPGGGAPSAAMIADAVYHGFLARQLEILRPKVLLLLGRHSYATFHAYLLGEPAKTKISDAFLSLSPATALIEYEGARVVPFLHPSPQSGTFSRWFSRSRRTLCEQPQIRALLETLSAGPNR